MKGKELQHKRAPQEAHANRSVKSKSKLRRFLDKSLLVGASVFAFGCAGSVAGTQSKVTVTPDKQKIEENNKVEKQKKTEISISELKSYQLKFKKKHGANYEMVSDNEDRFYLEVSFNKPIYLENGKKALVVMVHVSHKEEELKQGGDKVGYIFIRLVDKELNKVISAWGPDFDKLRKEYKNMTGKELKYVHVIVEHGGEGKDEYVQFYLIPASSKKAVEKGIIEIGMPIQITNITYDPEMKKYVAGSGVDEITASLDSEENNTLAKK